MRQNSVFIKMSQLLRGSSTFLSHIWRGWGGGVEKISDETGRGQKKFCDSNENVPDPYHPPPHPNTQPTTPSLNGTWKLAIFAVSLQLRYTSGPFEKGMRNTGTAELQWLENLLNHKNMFLTGVIRAIDF